MENTGFNRDQRRLEIALLYAISFFGYVMHSILHLMLSPGMDPAVVAENAAMMQLPSMQMMSFVMTITTIAPALLAIAFKSKKAWKIISIFSLLMLLMNTAHSIGHMTIGDVFSGGTTLVMQTIPGLWALIWSFKLIKKLD